MTPLADAGLALLRQLEGCRLEAYDDATGLAVPVGGAAYGTLTIGYGHTGPDVVAGLVWAPEQAAAQLAADVAPMAVGVDRLVTGHLSQNQRAAFVCLAFNIGLGAFGGSSALHLANQGALADVPAHIRLWDKVARGGVLVPSPGLVGRRAAEVALWLLPDGAAIPDFTAIRDDAVAAWRAHAA